MSLFLFSSLISMFQSNRNSQTFLLILKRRNITETGACGKKRNIKIIAQCIVSRFQVLWLPHDRVCSIQNARPILRKCAQQHFPVVHSDNAKVTVVNVAAGLVNGIILAVTTMTCISTSHIGYHTCDQEWRMGRAQSAFTRGDLKVTHTAISL